MIFLNSVSSAAALVFYLTALCTQTDIEGKQSSEYFEIFGKNTIFNEHSVSPMMALSTLFTCRHWLPESRLEYQLVPATGEPKQNRNIKTGKGTINCTDKKHSYI